MLLKTLKKILIILLVTNLTAIYFAQSDNDSTTIKIPIGGNTWIVNEKISSEGIITDDGITNWTNPKTKFRIYFKLPNSGKLKVYCNLKVNDGRSKIKFSLNGESKIISISNNIFKNIFVYEFSNVNTGYQFLELEGISKTGSNFAELKDLIISGEAAKGKTYFVKDDFYWGRRGPSVHLNFPIPENIKNAEWFYSEITVPKGEDVLGSYFMANGFAHGYFGIQVNSETERRILFSVWSPYDTQDPNNIPDEYKIKLINKGKDVHAGEFGSEGSGGQSYLKYNWKAGVNYSFLLRGIPVGDSITNYSAYFYSPEENEWKLIATFLRPFTDSYLTNLYSFLENFYTETGNVERMAYYKNQWICDSENIWHELTKAKFTADATARKKARMDFSGGIKEGEFYLKNCGFFDHNTEIGEIFKKNKLNSKPNINFDDLPK